METWSDPCLSDILAAADQLRTSNISWTIGFKVAPRDQTCNGTSPFRSDPYGLVILMAI